MEHKTEFKKVMSSQQTASQVKSGVDHNRLIRQTEDFTEPRESSIECGGVPILPGSEGEAGVRGSSWNTRSKRNTRKTR